MITHAERGVAAGAAWQPSWNPLYVRVHQVEMQSEGAAPEPQENVDATDPMVDARQIEELVEPLVERNGTSLERVQLKGATGIGNEFLRLRLREPGPRTDGIRQLLLSAPERVTGFRDLLVSEDDALAAALSLPQTNLAALCSQVDAPELAPRPVDLLFGLRDLSLFLAQAAEHGLYWAAPNIGQIGAQHDGPAAPAGLRRLHLMFTAWDQLSGFAGDPVDLLKALASALTLLREQADQSGFAYSAQQLDVLLSWLEEVSLQPILDYKALAELADRIVPRYELASQTNSGQVRDHNEDASLLLAMEQGSSTGSRLTLAAVADGMGGHQSGEVASSLALDLLRQQLAAALLAPRSSPVNPRRMPEQLAQIIPAIDRALSERAQLDPQLGGMGTTLVGFANLAQLSTQTADGAAAPGQSCTVVFNVGDSRAYLLTPTGLRRLSRDHSFVQDLLDSGAISADEAFDHPQKNVITRCLGGGDSSAEPDVHVFTPGPGEAILLASDGLTDMLTETQLWRSIGEADTADLNELAGLLIAAANEAGGKDNITVVLIGCAL